MPHTKRRAAPELLLGLVMFEVLLVYVLVGFITSWWIAAVLLIGWLAAVTFVVVRFFRYRSVEFHGFSDLPLVFIDSHIYLCIGGLAVGLQDRSFDGFVDQLATEGSADQIERAIATINRLFDPGAPVQWTDEQLLQTFITHRDRLQERAVELQQS